MGTTNKIAEEMETTTRATKIQATKVVLTELVITATSLDISKHIYIRNIGTDNQYLIKILITATRLDISEKMAARKKGIFSKCITCHPFICM